VARKVLRTLGPSDSGAEIQLVDGPYGPYLTNGELNASLPNGTDTDGLTPEDAKRFLAERGKPPKRRRKKK
jgi:DNA topoisomerase-1